MADEIRKVKRRREEREEQQMQWEAEKQRMVADQDGLTIEEWEERGLQFELDQITQRARNRLAEGRLQPVDVLLFTLRTLEKQEDADLLGGDAREFTRVISGLSIGDLKELVGELGKLVEYDIQHKELWLAMTAVATHELQEQLRSASSSHVSRSGVHSNVQDDVVKKFASKTRKELEEAEAQIQAMVRGAGAAGGAAVDTEYWDTILRQLAVWKERALLREFYHWGIRELRGGEAAADAAALPDGGGGGGADAGGAQRRAKACLCTEDSDEEEDAAQARRRRRREGPVSPQLRPLDTMTADEINALVAEEDDARDMWRKRKSSYLAADKKLEQEAMMMMSGQKIGEGEELFDEQVQVDQRYSWHDQYRPRKPKYFNRVHTGFEWNKYNSTHYDADNPPPKVVTGYKFNMFYPDLASETQQPVYFREPTERGWQDDTCILRFSAGPPYEDIAFRIVNKEWDTHKFANYICKFERGVLQLHFQFVRYRYRR